MVRGKQKLSNDLMQVYARSIDIGQTVNAVEGNPGIEDNNKYADAR